jgi:SAM-dependent methyltransferase
MTTLETESPTREVDLGTARDEVAAPFAAALRAHHKENWPQLLGVQHFGNDAMSWVTTGIWFGQDATRERIIDELIAAGIQGPVLDVGAGAGRMALKLQAAGVEVVALDCEPACVELLRAKGVRNVVHADIRTFETTQRFQTIAFMDSTFGLIGDVEAAGALLDKLRSLLLPDGVVLVQDGDFQSPVVELEWRFVFHEQVGLYFRWLNFSFPGLRETVLPHGWSARKLSIRSHPYYVAELRFMDTAGARVADFLRRRWFELTLLAAMIWAALRL